MSSTLWSNPNPDPDPNPNPNPNPDPNPNPNQVEYPLVVRLGPGRPPRMVQRRFRDFDRLYDKLARHVGPNALLALNPSPSPDPQPQP